MPMKKKQYTNEWEFQGQVLSWLNEEIRKRLGLGLDKVTQEPSKITPKRNDLVIWWNRASESALLTIELKTPETPITNIKLLLDACEKAQRWEAPFFAIWNMQNAELYRTPPPPAKVTPEKRIKAWATDPRVSTVNDWLNPNIAKSLQERSLEILDHAWQIHLGEGGKSLIIDASIFVEKLANHISRLQAEILPYLEQKSKTNRILRRKIRAFSAAQGIIGFVDDLNVAITGQFSYRLVGQILFYLALRKKQPSLPPLELSPSDVLPDALRPYWDDVRRFDYEALFELSELEQIVPVPLSAQKLILQLIEDLSKYDWNSLRDDVLGSVFENLIPTEEQHYYGQFYTPPQVADILIAFSIDGESPLILDPGCGSGTFLMRAYSFLKETTKLKHEDLLTLLWGFDISPFAAELAAINLFRQDLSAFENFPRIVRGNFFELLPGQEILFPPARIGGLDKVFIRIPKFDAVIGNPPYLRSQNQDDLDKNYKKKLFQAAKIANIPAASKTDLFTFFIYRSLEFINPGSRIAFVTSASWLTADFGRSLQYLLLDRLKIVALISSSVESFFSQVDVNTVLLITERRMSNDISENELLKFVTLKKQLNEFFPPGHDYWSQLTKFVDIVEDTKESIETENYRIKTVSAEKEISKLIGEPEKTRNWSLYLRAPLSYFELYGDD